MVFDNNPFIFIVMIIIFTSAAVSVYWRLFRTDSSKYVIISDEKLTWETMLQQTMK